MSADIPDSPAVVGDGSDTEVPAGVLICVRICAPSAETCAIMALKQCTSLRKRQFLPAEKQAANVGATRPNSDASAPKNDTMHLRGAMVSARDRQADNACRLSEEVPVEINSGAAGRNILQIVDTNPTADFARAVSSAAASAVAAAVKSTDQYRLPERIEAQVQKLGEAVALSTYLRCRTEEDAMKQQREWAIVKTYRLGTIPDDQRHGEHR